MRIFLGLDVEKELLKNEMRKAKKILEKYGVRAKVVPVENMHITYVFFGEMSKEDVEKIVRVLDESYVKLNVKHVKLTHVSHFSYRVLFFHAESEEIKKHREEVVDALKKGGIAWDEDRREFHPHITIARVKYGMKDEITREINDEFTPLTLPVRELCLFESILSREGARYEKIKCWK